MPSKNNQSPLPPSEKGEEISPKVESTEATSLREENTANYIKTLEAQNEALKAENRLAAELLKEAEVKTKVAADRLTVQDKNGLTYEVLCPRFAVPYGEYDLRKDELPDAVLAYILGLPNQQIFKALL